MARDSSGTKNQPQYDGTGAPSDAADLSEVSNYAALVGNRKALTSAQRASLSGADLWDGLEVVETDTGVTYQYGAPTGSGWRRTGPTIGQLMRRTSDFALTNGSYVAVPFDVADINAGMWSSGNPTRFTAPVAGVYRFSGNRNQVNSTGNGAISPRLNGATALADFVVASSSGAAFITWSIEVYLAAGDFVEITAFTSGGSFPWIAANRVAAVLALAA